MERSGQGVSRERPLGCTRKPTRAGPDRRFAQERALLGPPREGPAARYEPRGCRQGVRAGRPGSVPGDRPHLRGGGRHAPRARRGARPLQEKARGLARERRCDRNARLGTSFIRPRLGERRAGGTLHPAERAAMPLLREPDAQPKCTQSGKSPTAVPGPLRRVRGEWRGHRLGCLSAKSDQRAPDRGCARTPRQSTRSSRPAARAPPTKGERRHSRSLAAKGIFVGVGRGGIRRSASPIAVESY